MTNIRYGGDVPPQVYCQGSAIFVWRLHLPFLDTSNLIHFFFHFLFHTSTLSSFTVQGQQLHYHLPAKLGIFQIWRDGLNQDFDSKIYLSSDLIYQGLYFYRINSDLKRWWGQQQDPLPPPSLQQTGLQAVQPPSESPRVSHRNEDDDHHQN